MFCVKNAFLPVNKSLLQIAQADKTHEATKRKTKYLFLDNIIVKNINNVPASAKLF